MPAKRAKSDELLAAVAFAAHKHRLQKRKGRIETPYIQHPIQVAETLARVGKVTSRDVLIAAVLHDTIEDTDATRAEIAREFGARVAALVAEVTDDKSLPKQRRKSLQIEHAPHLSREAKLIKLSDRICNVRDLVEDPPRGWSLERRHEYVAWSAQVVAAIRGTHPALERCFDRTARRSRRILAAESGGGEN